VKLRSTNEGECDATKNWMNSCFAVKMASISGLCRMGSCHCCCWTVTNDNVVQKQWSPLRLLFCIVVISSRKRQWNARKHCKTKHFHNARTSALVKCRLRARKWVLSVARRVNRR
jgi:hypothetical protein